MFTHAKSQYTTSTHAEFSLNKANLFLLVLIRDKIVSGIRAGDCPSPLSMIEKDGLVFFPDTTSHIFFASSVLCLASRLDNFPS